MPLQCRICLDDDEMQNLVSPCNCSGTSKYIHPHCLTIWRNQNIDTPYYKTCIDCRTDYKYSVELKEKMIVSSKAVSYIQIGLLGLITLLLSSYDDDASFKIFNYIKNKNMTHIFHELEHNYYYIFYHIILANYLINIGFLIVSYIFLFRIVNLKQYLLLMFTSKLYNIIKLIHIIIIYIAFSIQTFLSISFLLVFIDSVIIYLYIEDHNKILTRLNADNIVYYLDNVEPIEINANEESSDTDYEDSVTNYTGGNCIDSLI
jgi:hypothetical protein